MATVSDSLTVRSRVTGQVVGQLGKLTRPLLWACFVLLFLVPTASFLLVAFSPAVFDQGPQWLTIKSFVDAFQGYTLRGMLNSLIVGTATALLALVLSTSLAWVIHRTTIIGRGIWSIGIWAILLMPSYLTALGWESLLERGGVLSGLGFDPTIIRDVFYGPVGIIWILAAKGVPFGYLAISAGLLSLGREFEDAARVHGASPWDSLKISIAMLAPALWSTIAIVFAEAISDFGVASTLAAEARFPVATFTLYRAIDSMPVQFPVASAISWFLVASAGLALFVQYRSMSGGSYAVLSGRTRPISATRLSVRGQALALFGVIVFFVLALGVPVIGGISASLLKDFGAHFTLASVTFENYQRALSTTSLISPLLLSGEMAAITATLTVVLGALIGHMLSRRHVDFFGRSLDLLLLGAVALPSIVLAAGYIFAYNLPILGKIGINLYGTLFLLGAGYLSAALPSTSRLLIAPLAQIQSSLFDAARVHGATEIDATLTTVVPLLARTLVWAWLLTMSGTLLELPVSEILYPPGNEPLAVAIIKHLETYDFAGGSAMMIIAALAMLGVVGVVLGAFKLLAPAGWQRMKAR